MNAVALRSSSHEAAAPPATTGQMARVEIFHDFAAAEPFWRAIERGAGPSAVLATPYQSFDFLKLWHRHIGAAEGMSPFLVVGLNEAGAPLFLWPFGRRRFAGRHIVEFLGGKHANFNMALWQRDAAATIGTGELHGVLAHLAPHADLIMLANQPLTWTGAANPFALMPRQPSASFAFSGALAPDFDALLNARTNANTRKKMRKKERTLTGFGAVRFQKAQDSADIHAVLDDFFAQKTARTRAIGLPDVFSDTGVRQFIQAAAETPSADGGPLIELYTLTVDDVVVATIGGIVSGGRFSGMFLSIIHGRYAPESPGEQLIVNIVRHCCQRGLQTFDLGIGEAKYKGLFCPDAEPLFDSLWPLTRAGRRLAVAFRLMGAAKRAVKQTPALWALVTAARRLRARLTPKPL